MSWLELRVCIDGDALDALELDAVDMLDDALVDAGVPGTAYRIEKERWLSAEAAEAEGLLDVDDHAQPDQEAP